MITCDTCGYVSNWEDLDEWQQRDLDTQGKCACIHCTYGEVSRSATPHHAKLRSVEARVRRLEREKRSTLRHIYRVVSAALESNDKEVMLGALRHLNTSAELAIVSLEVPQ